MKKFSALYVELEQEHRYKRRVDLLAGYFQTASAADGTIALSILLGYKNKSVTKKEMLAQLACDAAQINAWMFEECLAQGSNYLDVVSLLIPRGNAVKQFSLKETLDRIESLRKLDPVEFHQSTLHLWSRMDAEERIVFNQLLCGLFNFEVSFDELSAALAVYFGLEKEIMSLRLSKWKPMKSTLNDLRLPFDVNEELALPEFYQAGKEWYDELESELIPEDFHAKWVFDGIGVQVIKLKEEIFIWGSNSELYCKRYPEVESFFLTIEGDYILHGTLVGWGSDGVDKVMLQRRESKKNITAKVIADFPVRLIIDEVRFRKLNSKVTDVLSGKILHRFLQQLNRIDSPFIWNEKIVFSSWEELFSIQIKHKLRGSLGLEIYAPEHNEAGFDRRKRYFKKNESHSLNLILLYVKSGTHNGDISGEEYTFGVVHASSYLPVARVTSLHDESERAYIRDFVKFNTVEKFGPVRNVKPMLVYKISFTSIYLNKRKKSGVEVVNSKVICRLAHLNVKDAHAMQDVMNFLSPSAGLSST